MLTSYRMSLSEHTFRATASYTIPGCASDSMSDIFSPLVSLLTRFCLGDKDVKLRIKTWSIPKNLDRTNPLEVQSCIGALSTAADNRVVEVQF